MNISDQITFRMDNGDSLRSGVITQLNVTHVDGFELDQSDLPAITVACADESIWTVPVAWVLA